MHLKLKRIQEHYKKKVTSGEHKYLDWVSEYLFCRTCSRKINMSTACACFYKYFFKIRPISYHPK